MSNQSLRWAGALSIAAGVLFLVPLVFYFALLPAAGSSAEHARDPASFLPWMAEKGDIRIALWWIVALAFTVTLFSVPHVVKKRLETTSPSAARASELAGILASFALVVSSLILAAGESAIAHAYVKAGIEGQTAIVALYEWQRLTTALLFDVLGFAFLGISVGVGSIAALRFGGLSKSISVFGAVTSVLCFCFAVGYATQIGWLGELGIGVAVFVALPAWFIWLGIMAIR